MKKIIIITILILFSCKKEKSEFFSENFILNGIVKDDFKERKVFLKSQENGVLNILDSTTIINGKFEFKGSIEKPEVYGIFIDSMEDAIGIFMENKNITIEANMKKLSSSKITGSTTNDDYLDYIKVSNKIISEMNILFPEFQKARAENDAEKLEKINKKMQLINDKNTVFAYKYAKQNPNSYISAVALLSILNIGSVNKDSIELVYSGFSDYVKKGDYSKEILEYLETSQK